MISATEFGRRPQVFITRVMEAEDLPDVEILTLSAYESLRVGLRWPRLAAFDAATLVSSECIRSFAESLRA